MRHMSTQKAAGRRASRLPH